MGQADTHERAMLALVNADRAQTGAPPLQLEQRLNAAAEAHSEWMLATGTFSHTGQGGSSATDRMVSAGFDFSGTWRSAENIAIQSERGAPGVADDVRNLHATLMQSPGHRANLLDPALRYIGIGIEEGPFAYSGGPLNSVIVTQTFAATQGRVRLDAARQTEDVFDFADLHMPNPNDDLSAPAPDRAPLWPLLWPLPEQANADWTAPDLTDDLPL